MDNSTDNYGFSPKIAQDMREKHVDLRLTRKLLDRFNAGDYAHIEPVKVSDIPEVDGKRIIDMTGDLQVVLPVKIAKQNIARLGIGVDPVSFGKVSGTEITFDRHSLTELGVALYPVLSYGILNGGSASSYFDHKKNEAFNSTLYQICRHETDTLEKLAKDKAKGLAPAFINPDGTPGPSFIELKMRSLLIEILRYQRKYRSDSPALAPLFQMTSINNDSQISAAYREYQKSSYLQPLIEASGVDITQAMTGIQPMVAAFTHSKKGTPKEVFSNAYGQENTILPMPGGHGQNFEILKEVYQSLLGRGKKYVYLGNVDNLGFTVDPVSLALIALQHKQAGFEFSFRTAVDIKGGILIRDQFKRLNCADIGPAISADEVLHAEASGKNILFNCATGLFDLEYLVVNLEQIIDNLPVRFSDQDKDAGMYSQAEQVTWEIIGMLDDFLIFGVNKYQRFLAAKLVLENLMASGVALDNPLYPTSTDPKHDLKGIAVKLHQGLIERLTTVYGMKRINGRWIPKTPAELSI